MPRNSPESLKNRLDRRNKSEAKHIFDLCGWEVWIDPLNYQIRKDGKTYYFSTLLNTLKGIRGELDIKATKYSNDIETSIEKVKSLNEKFIKDLNAVLASYTSLGQLEWH